MVLISLSLRISSAASDWNMFFSLVYLSSCWWVKLCQGHHVSRSPIKLIKLHQFKQRLTRWFDSPPKRSLLDFSYLHQLLTDNWGWFYSPRRKLFSLQSGAPTVNGFTALTRRTAGCDLWPLRGGGGRTVQPRGSTEHLWGNGCALLASLTLKFLWCLPLFTVE